MKIWITIIGWLCCLPLLAGLHGPTPFGLPTQPNGMPTTHVVSCPAEDKEMPEATFSENHRQHASAEMSATDQRHPDWCTPASVVRRQPSPSVRSFRFAKLPPLRLTFRINLPAWHAGRHDSSRLCSWHRVSAHYVFALRRILI